MIAYDIRDTSIVVGGNEGQFPEEVKKAVEVDDRLVILQNTLARKNIPDNVWAITEAGTIEWKIEQVYSQDPYTGLWQEDGELWAYNWDGYGYQINKDDGRIVDHKFMK